MMIEQFIDRLEQQGLLEKAVVDDLRRKVARAKGKKITPEAIAKYLVDKGHLTQFQATKLVNDVTKLVGRPPAEEPVLEVGDDELTLLPDDDATRPYMRSTRPTAGPSPQPVRPTADGELDDLLNIDDRTDQQKRQDAQKAARRAAEEKAAAERQAAEKQAAEKREAEKREAEKREARRAAERAAAEKQAAERRAAAEKAAADKAAAEKAAAEKAAAERAAAEKAAAEKLAAEKLAAEKLAAEKAAAEKAAAEKAAADKAAADAADATVTALEGEDLVEVLGHDDLVEVALDEPQAPMPPPRKKRSRHPEPPPPSRPNPGADDLMADLEASSQLASTVGRAPVQRKLQKSSDWDSWLLMVGGTSLGVLIVVGILLYLSLTRGVAEELLATAEKAYQDESYALAVKLYDDFVEDYPGHEKVSTARVMRESAQLRQVYKDPEKGLAVAQERLPLIKQEEKFPDIRGELASMLPQIARGFVDRALQATDPGVQEQLLEKTQQAMELVDDPEYIPSTLRKSQQTAITGVEEDIARVRREIDRERTLAETVRTITAAVAAGDTQQAYQARQALLDQYPGLDTNEALHEAVLTVSEKERENVHLVEEPITGITDDVAGSAARSVVLAHQMGKSVGGVADRVVYVLAAGSVFALDAASGEVLWRRHVGTETTTHPIPVSKALHADAIVVDRRRDEVMRLAARDGKVVWRLPVGEPFADPVLVDSQLYVAAASGRLLLVDVETGVAPRHLQIPQPLEVGPGGINEERPCIYQTGDQDNLYVISRENLECVEVYYIGHKRGTIVVPPVMGQGYLLVVENAGPDFCYVHVIECDQDGRDLRAAQEKIRLQGQVLVQPVLGRRRVLFVTDQRAVELFDIDQNAETSPVVSAGRHSATKEDPIISYPLLSGGYMWVANDRFTKYQVQASSGKLPSEWVLDEQDLYVSPLQMVEDVIIHVRRRQGATGYTVAATRVNDKEPVWQTELAVPVRSMLAKSDGPELVTSRGRLFNVTAEVLEQGVVNHATSSALRDEKIILALSESVPLEEGVRVLTPRAQYTQAVFHRAEGEYAGLKTLTLSVPADEAAREPTPFAGGLLIPLRDGRVMLADPVTGGERAKPFHPAIEAGVSSGWLAPAVLDNGTEVVIANDRKQLYRVGVVDKPTPHLQQLGLLTVTDNLVGALAATGQACYAVTRAAGGDTLASITLPQLTAGQQWPLAGRLLWGPQRVGDVVLLATDTQLKCVDDQQAERWSVPWDRGPIVGQPVAVDNQLLVVTRAGAIVALAADGGETVAATDVGEPLAAGPVLEGDQVLVFSESGVMFQIARPGP